MGGRGGRIRTDDLRFWRPTLCQLSYAPAYRLLRFAMHHVFSAARAVFLQLQPVALLLAMLGGRVVPRFALGTRQHDNHALTDRCHRLIPPPQGGGFPPPRAFSPASP